MDMLFLRAGRSTIFTACLIASFMPLCRAESIDASTSVLLDQLLAQEAAGQHVDRLDSLKTTDLNPMANWQAGRIIQNGQWVSLDELDANNISKEFELYIQRRDQATNDLQGHRQLAVWAEKHNLAEQATAHWNEVLTFDPNDATARKKLGHVLIDNRWIEKSELDAARLANKERIAALKKWMPEVQRIVSMLESSDSKTKLKGLKQLEAINDDQAASSLQIAILQLSEPLALPMVATLKNMHSTKACYALVNVVLADPNSKVGLAAMEGLKDYDAHFYVPELLSMLELPASVRHELVYNGNGDLILQQIVDRETQDTKEQYVLRKLMTIDTGSTRQVESVTAPSDAPFGYQFASADRLTIKARNAQAQKSAEVLAGIEASERAESLNKQNLEAAKNQIAIKQILSQASGISADENSQAFWNWWPSYNERGTRFNKQEKRYYDEDYSSAVVQNTTGQQTFLQYSAAPPPPPRYDCVVAGTLVQTSRGMLPVESLKAGDLVAAMDVESGELAMRPITFWGDRTAEKTFKIATTGGSLVEATGGHFWWVLGEGWVRSRELKPGMLIRTAHSSVEVASVESNDKPTLVYNFVVDSSHTYFVGKERWLSWDVTALKPTLLKVPGFANSNKIAMQ